MDLEQLEAFALAADPADRRAALAQLIPGTADHYYYSCVLLQQAGELDRVDELVRAWRGQRRHDHQLEIIERRQELLRLEGDPRAAEALRRRLGVRFDHQRRVPLARGAHPSRLDPALLERSAQEARARAEHPGRTDGFTDAALPWLAATSLDPGTRRHLLERLERPDVPGLVELIAADLGARGGRFGSLAIHRLLLPEQLDELQRLRPGLAEDAAFVEVRLSRLQPGPDEERGDPEVERAFLERLWGAAERLAPSFNSLRAHVLYHLLDRQRRAGEYDRGRFLAYLAMPRHVGYAHRAIREPKGGVGLAELDARFGSTALPPVGSDEDLVSDYLAHFLAGADDAADFAPYLDAAWLRRHLATTKILLGEGDLERWAAMLDDAAAFAALRDRVDIDLVPENRERWAEGEPVVIEAEVKNVRTLVINVFEINVPGYFARHGRDVDTAIDLDGLVAGRSQTHRFDEPPYRRARRRFEIDGLEAPGTYVVELIGGGKSSRALIRRGGLRLTDRLGAAGHVFAVLDEGDRPATGAALSFGGHRFEADERGEIAVPFSTRPGQVTALLEASGRSQVVQFLHRAEDYRLAAGFFVERESLVAGATAEVAVRPMLSVAGCPVDLSLLEDAALIVETTDRRGIAARRELRDLELSGAAELTRSFRVPENLAQVSFTLRGKVRSLTEQRDVELSCRGQVAVNGIEETAHIGALHLAGPDPAGEYALFVLGKSGEPRAGVAVNLWIAHRDFTAPLEVTLQADDDGCVSLGPLPGILSVSATDAAGVTERWQLADFECRYPPAIHVAAGEPVLLPVAGPDRAAVSLLRRGGSGGFVADCSEAARFEDGALVIEGLAPGAYHLHLADSGADVELRVSAGERRGRWLVGRAWYLEATPRRFPRITGARVEEGELVVSVAATGERARLHAVATHFYPARSLASALGWRSAPAPSVRRVWQPRSAYVSGRDVGDEMRYVLERRHAEKYPGAAVGRPGLLLNPWDRRSTETGHIGAAAGSAYDARSIAPAAPMAAPGGAARPAPEPASGIFANLDFLAPDTAVARFNLECAGEEVRIDLEGLGAAAAVHLLLVDDAGTCARRVALPEPEASYRDLRLARSIDPARHASETRQITPLVIDAELRIDDIASSSLEVVDTLSRVHQIYCAVSGDATLAEFAFAVRWPELGDAERRELYSRYACHELNLFLSFKDATFFAEVIRPYLADKLHPTFLDRYLVGADLASYLEPWAYGRLNTLERILLGGRSGIAGPTARHLRDRFELVPPDAERAQHLFDVVLGGSSLESGGALNFEAAKAEAAPAPRMKKRARRATGAREVAAAPPPMAQAMTTRAGMIADEAMEEVAAAGYGGGGDLLADLARRDEQRQLYRSPERTREWAENNYYHLRPSEQGPELIGVNGFWVDFAEREAGRPFLSPRFAEATSCFAEMMAALAVLDLPFAAGEHAVDYSGGAMDLRAGGAALAFHKEIRDVEIDQPPKADRSRGPLVGEPSPKRVPVLVSQNYFRADDRYRWEGGEQIDKYVSGELLTQVVYLCQVVLTNPSSSRQRLEVLLQVPAGAIPVAGGYPTRGVAVDLDAYGTRSIEYQFYFPEAGSFEHYPAQVTRDELLIAAAEPATLVVTGELGEVDRDSWAHVSQNGDADQVIAHLEAANIERLDLDAIAWRMSDPGFFERILALLESRRVYSDTLWSYALYHRDVARAAEYLRHRDDLLAGCGPALVAGPLEIDPVARGSYEHLEYEPLVNARAHALGARRRIANGALESQYRGFLDVLAHRAALGAADWLEAAYYYFLQDRVADGLAAMERARGGEASPLQLDYMEAYAALLRGDLAAAAAAAERRAGHPVDRWRRRFEAVEAVLARAEGDEARVTDEDDRRQRQDQLASTEAAFDLAVGEGRVTISYQNLAACQVSYYLMDIELLFSRQPFLRHDTARFALIRPNRSESMALPAGRHELGFDIPAELGGKNLVIEVEAGGSRKAEVHYAHRLSVRLVAQYGQLRVGARESGRPEPGVYVKVYARMGGGDVAFYKDGYTDVTGGFDYASLSTDDLDRVERFAILILSDERGAVIRETEPPSR